MKSETAAQPLLPLLPLRDVVVFPHMVIPLFVGREKSIAALEAATAATMINRISHHHAAEPPRDSSDPPSVACPVDAPCAVGATGRGTSARI